MEMLLKTTRTELAHRSSDGVDVTLVWATEGGENQVVVSVCDRRGAPTSRSRPSRTSRSMSTTTRSPTETSAPSIMKTADSSRSPMNPGRRLRHPKRRRARPDRATAAGIPSVIAAHDAAAPTRSTSPAGHVCSWQRTPNTQQRSCSSVTQSQRSKDGWVWDDDPPLPKLPEAITTIWAGNRTGGIYSTPARNMASVRRRRGVSWAQRVPLPTVRESCEVQTASAGYDQSAPNGDLPWIMRLQREAASGGDSRA